MAPMIILLLIVAGPAALLIFLRVNAAFAFLSLCLGSVLVQFVASDAQAFFTKPGQNVSDNVVKLGLLLLPAVLTTLFMVKTVKHRYRLLNILPALGTGLLLALLVVPLLPPGTAANIITSSVWRQVTRSQDLVVGGSALVSMVFLWLQRPKAVGKDHGKH